MLSIIISLSLTLLPLARAQCYGQSSNILSTDRACDTGSNPTFCCPASSSCLDVGICKKNGKLLMGSCSDPNWSGQCTKYCPDGAGISNCQTSDSDDQYCCTTGSNKNGQDRCCLGTTFLLGSLGDANTLSFTNLATSTSKQPSSTAKTSQKTTSSSATGKSTAKSSTGSSSTDSSSSSITTQTTGASAAASTTAASDQSQTTDTSTQTSTPTVVAIPASKGLSSGAKIGVGVGAALGFAFLGFALFAIMFLCRRRQQDKRNAIRLSGLRAKAETSRSFSNNSGYTGVSEATGLQQERSSTFPVAPIYGSQYSKPLPHQPREITSIPETEHLLTPEPPPFDLPTQQGQAVVAPVQPPAQRQVYRAYQPPPGRIETNELGFPHVRKSSGPSFSELVTPTSATTSHPPPFRTLTPAQELAAARARSNMTPSSPQNARRGDTLRREDSVVSGISGRSARDRERDRTTLSRGDSVVSGRTEYRASRNEQ